MFQAIRIALLQATETFVEDGLKHVFDPRVFLNREITPAVMDLSTVPTSSALLRDIGYQFVELKLEDLQAGKWRFMVPSRRFKALRNTKRGWRGFAIVEGDLVIGDVWCVTPSGDGVSIIHSDLAMLGITCEEKDVYAFDMQIATAFRGKNLAVPLQRFLHTVLKAEGFRKVYGAYWNDNRPALWMHRMLKYKELPKRSVSRFFFLQRSRNAD
jgi:GNAT superfamily N-acetyltransferase